VSQVLSHAVLTEMKEIKGLEERLYGLEQLMVETKKIVQEQSDLTQVHVIFKSRPAQVYLIFNSSVIIEFTLCFVLPN
jgi:hypothetical protein